MARLYSTPSFSTLKVEQLKGSDSSVPEDQMKPYRAAKSENMIPGAVGEVRKRPGVHREKTVSTHNDDTYKIVEMIGGKHPIFYRSVRIPGYEIHYNTGSETVLIAMVEERPTVIPYEGKWIIFATTLGGYDYGKVGGKANADYSFRGAMILLGFEQSVEVYTDSGMHYYYSDGDWSFKRISPDDALLTTPIILKGCDPAGGGATFQQVNLLNPWVTESFCCKNEQTGIFYLQNKVNDTTDDGVRWEQDSLSDYFRIEVLCAITDEELGLTFTRWIERKFDWTITGNEAYTPDAYRPAANRIFLAPEGNVEVSYAEAEKTYRVMLGTGQDNWIGKTPVEGEDNVRITHWRASFQEEFIRICGCACGTTFGVGGYKDRLFLGGGQNESNTPKNRICYSELEDPFYIGDLDYLKLDTKCDILALDGTADTLAALTDQGVYLIKAAAQANTEDVMYVSDALFTVAGKVVAPAPLNCGNTAVLGGEIVYLSKEGVIAVAYKESFDERFAEHRSAMIDREMLQDDPQQLLSLGRFLLIRCADGVWWLLDENQPNSEGDKPYSSHQYEGYRLSGMFADAAWVEDDRLRLVMGGDQYYWTDGTAATHYYDAYPTADGSNVAAINAWWETPWLYGNDFYRNKTFKKLGLLLGQVTLNNAGVPVIGDTAVKVEGKKNDEDWTTLWDYDGTLCSFNYENLDYRLFTYAGAPGIPALNRKIKIKKAKRFKLRFSNHFIDQTFVLRQFGLEYVQGG